MSKRIQRLSAVLFVVDMLLVPVGIWLSVKLRSTVPLGRGGALPAELIEVPLVVYGLAIVCWSVGLLSGGAYDPRLIRRWYWEVGRVVWGSLIATVLMAGVLYMSFRELSRLQFVYIYFLIVGLVVTYRGTLRIYYRLFGRTRPGGRSRVLILGAGELGERVAKIAVEHGRWGIEAVGFLDDDAELRGQIKFNLPVLGSINDLRDVLGDRKVDEAWIALPAAAHERIAEIVAAVERLPVRIKVVPDYFSLALVQANTEVLDGVPLIGLRDPLIEGFPRLIKRALDLVITIMLLLPGLPIMGAIALLIRIDSPGDSWFRQQRVGENGREFGMYKFRTMRAGSDSEEGPADEGLDTEPIVHKRRGDPRVTNLGRFLRRFSLDELPQLINVLKGEMSLVGPRPEMPWLVDRYDSWQRKRFAVPQGLTGWWQINGRSDKPMHLNTEDDLYYIYNYSLLLDLIILARTPFAILSGRGAF